MLFRRKYKRTLLDSLYQIGLIPCLRISIAEANLLVICASLPTVRKFFSHVATKLKVVVEKGHELYGGEALDESIVAEQASVVTIGRVKVRGKQNTQSDSGVYLVSSTSQQTGNCGQDEDYLTVINE